MSFSEGEVLTLSTRAKKPEWKCTCRPGLSLSPYRAILSKGGHGGSWVRKVSESAMLGTQSEKVCSSLWTGCTQPSTCTHGHAHYPGTSPFHFTTKGSTGAEYPLQGRSTLPGASLPVSKAKKCWLPPLRLRGSLWARESYCSKREKER